MNPDPLAGLSPESRQHFEYACKNMSKFVGYQLRKFHVRLYTEDEFEDLVSAAKVKVFTSSTRFREGATKCSYKTFVYKNIQWAVFEFIRRRTETKHRVFLSLDFDYDAPGRSRRAEFGVRRRQENLGEEFLLGELTERKHYAFEQQRSSRLQLEAMFRTSRLTALEQQVMNMIMNDKSIEDISVRMGYSYEWIRQTRHRAILKIRRRHGIELEKRTAVA